MGRTLVIVTSATLMASACSPGVETRISSTGIDALHAQSLAIIAEQGISAELQSAYAMATRSLAEKGYVVAENAALHLEVTVDARDAALALNSGPVTLSAAKKKKPFQSCIDKEYRVGVTITKIADGTEVYQGQAAEYHCKMTLDEAMPDMIAAALGDLGKPRGSYTMTRSAKD